MSNRNRGTQNPNNGTQNGAPKEQPPKEPKEKKTLTQRIIETRDKVMATKVGRIAVKGLKVIGVGGIAFASYKAGVKSVKPVTVYIREGVTEEPKDEPKESEPAEETGEVIEDE